MTSMIVRVRDVKIVYVVTERGVPFDSANGGYKTSRNRKCKQGQMGPCSR
jgi:hypothetical protein